MLATVDHRKPTPMRPSGVAESGHPRLINTAKPAHFARTRLCQLPYGAICCCLESGIRHTHCKWEAAQAHRFYLYEKSENGSPDAVKIPLGAFLTKYVS